MENGVSVDDFRQPGNLVGSAAACGPAKSLPHGHPRNIAMVGGARSAPRDDWPELRKFVVDGGTRARGSVRDRAPEAALDRRSRDAANVVGRRSRNRSVSRPADAGATRPSELAAAPVDFNVSHTRGMALIAIAQAAPEGKRIGVDVEHCDRQVNADGLSRKFLSDANAKGWPPWRRSSAGGGSSACGPAKEAMSKATGDALAAFIPAPRGVDR